MEDQNILRFDRKRLIDRGMDEFIGICKGIIFDGVVVYEEARNLLIWLENNREVANKWPANELHAKLSVMLDGGALNSEDEGLLLAFLSGVTGKPEVMMEGDNASMTLPLCSPAPEVFFEGAVFVISGNLKLGSRKEVVNLIESLGGEVVLKNVRMDTNFLVIGDIGSKAWLHSTHGKKIERAVELRDEKNTGINIISEEHFAKHLI